MRSSSRHVIPAAFILISFALTSCISEPKNSVLLFTGTGTSPNDVAAISTALDTSHLTYSTADSPQLNRMSTSQMSDYRLLIMPGGNFVDMGNGLSTTTLTNIHNAINSDMNYLGICAGAFLAAYFPPPYKSLNLTSGLKFGFYSPGNNQSKAAVDIQTADGQSLDQYWENGPRLTGWGDVVAKYPDGTPAIVEGSVGKGWIILTGLHSEAPANWRYGMDFHTPVNEDNAYAQTLITAAPNHKALPHF